MKSLCSCASGPLPAHFWHRWAHTWDNNMPEVCLPAEWWYLTLKNRSKASDCKRVYWHPQWFDGAFAHDYKIPKGVSNIFLQRNNNISIPQQGGSVSWPVTLEAFFPFSVISKLSQGVREHDHSTSEYENPSADDTTHSHPIWKGLLLVQLDLRGE